MKAKHQSRLLVLFGVSLGLVVPIFGGRPVLIMIVSQALTVIVSPLILGLMFYLYNRKSVMGHYVMDLKNNIILGIIILFTVFMSYAGVKGIIGLF